MGDTRVDLPHLAHRQLIGYLGLFLPALVWAVAGLRPTNGLPRWCLLPSVSAYGEAAPRFLAALGFL